MMRSAWFVIALAGAGTFALRASFLLAARRLVDVPPAVREVLRMIPAAALAAIIAPAIVRPEGHLDPFGPRFLAGILAVLVAWRTRNLLVTISTGLFAVVILERVVG